MIRELFDISPFLLIVNIVVIIIYIVTEVSKKNQKNKISNGLWIVYTIASIIQIVIAILFHVGILNQSPKSHLLEKGFCILIISILILTLTILNEKSDDSVTTFWKENYWVLFSGILELLCVFLIFMTLL